MLIIYLFIIIILILWKIRLSKDNDYLSKEQCNSIKGIFILMIFLTHSMYYINASGYEYPGFDFLTPIITNYIGQLVVVMFLFYSGYGVASQIARKGDKYISQIPKHRILTTVINFDVAVCIFIVLNLLLSRPMSVSQILFSFIAWDSVGNSNWYIFVILICYCFTYIANKLSIRYVGGGFLFFV